MTAWTQITNFEIFAFIAVLVFEFLSRKCLLWTLKTIETIENFTGKLLKKYK